MRIFSILGAAAVLGCAPAFADQNAPAHVMQLSAELEMPDFHESTKLPGPLKVGTPVVLRFKNDTTVTVVPEKIGGDIITLSTRLVRDGGAVLYNATFITRYNVDAELSEKNPNGDLIYRLKLDPQVQTQ